MKSLPRRSRTIVVQPGQLDSNESGVTGESSSHLGGENFLFQCLDTNQLVPRFSEILQLCIAEPEIMV
jgi:hypothetical protein